MYDIFASPHPLYSLSNHPEPALSFALACSPVSLALALTSTTVAKPEAATRLGLTLKNIVSKFTYFKENATDVVDGGKERRPSPVYGSAAGGAKVIVTDVADGCAASGLVMKGDKLLSINGTRVTDEVQGRTLAKAAVGEVVFSIQRGGGRVTATAYKLEAATRLGVTIKDHLSEVAEEMEAEVEASTEAEGAEQAGSETLRCSLHSLYREGS